MDKITIEIESEKLQRALSEVQQRIGDMSPLMADIGELLTQSTKHRFATSTGPDGTPWAPLKDGSGRKPLVLTGTMRDQIFPTSGPDFVEIGASVKQAPWHQFGVDPFQIETKNFGFVDHPGIPARPFLGVSADDDAEIIKLAGAYLDVFQS